MRFVCLTLLAFLCGALLASVLRAQEPDSHYFSTRRGNEPQSNSVLTKSNVLSDIDFASSKDQGRSGNQSEIVHVALNYSTPPVKSILIGQGTPTGDTVVYQAPVEIYEEQTFIQNLSTPFNPPVPADQLAGPTFGDTYFAGKHVDEWSGYCRMKSVQDDLCCWFYADGGGCDGCGANRHRAMRPESVSIEPLQL